MEKDDNIDENADETLGFVEPDLKNEYIDKLTLELFMNRNNYNKYLAKNDPVKYDKLKEYKIKLKKYMVEIIDITSELIMDPEHPPNSEISDAFSDYSKSIIKYLDMKELEKTNSFYKKDTSRNVEEDDTMFDPEKMDVDTDNDNSRPKWSGHTVKKRYSNGFFF